MWILKTVTMDQFNNCIPAFCLQLVCIWFLLYSIMPALYTSLHNEGHTFPVDETVRCYLRLCFLMIIKICSVYSKGLQFLHAKAATVFSASQRNSVCLSVRPSITWVDESKTVQDRITKSLLSLPGRLKFQEP